MTKKIRLYHNPRCSKSRKAFQLLLDKKIKFEDYRYLNIGIDIGDIEILSKLPGVIRQNNDHGPADWTIEQIQRELKKHPENLQRPILIFGDKAVIGRPPEKILTLLP